MIYIIGTHVHASNVATGAGLEAREWTLLNAPFKLMGTFQPHVVHLSTAEEALGTKVLNPLMDMLFDREAILWTEMDLINRKVPR